MRKPTGARKIISGALAAVLSAVLLLAFAGVAHAGPSSGTVEARFLSSAAPGSTVQLTISTREPAVPNPVYEPRPLDQGYFAVSYDPAVLSFVGRQNAGSCTVTQAGYAGGLAQAECPESYAGRGAVKTDVFTLRVAAGAQPGTAQAYVSVEYSTVNASATPVLTIGRPSVPRIVGHVPPVSDTEAIGQGCADVMFVGVRGSGQTQSWGGEVSVVANQVDRLLPRSISLRQVYINYTAASVTSIATNGYGQYFDSIADGQNRLTRLLTRAATSCPDEKWILAGYSQGALVVNLASRGWGGDKHLAAVNLIADPNRFPGRDGMDFGSAGANRGVYAAGMEIATPLPRALEDKTFNICNKMDVVCDTTNRSYAPLLPLLLAGGPLGGLAGGSLVKGGVDAHLAYARTSAHLLRAMGSHSGSDARRALGR
ncbi:cutinase family protein [Blastococcus sp. TF02A_35]|uniref:cutinase family protein n=1 Tax=Blastococcus sp. TF02A-35 TaxID=2559612 RepID=UPI0010733E1E|nr:cutinase family protein [Blastococcus sp. TF02A_35]TFV51716.1 cutinase family protein [Blastococcus sp. TF02A_35]